MYSSSSVSDGSGCAVSSTMPVLKWKDCTTTDKKIGFLIGQAIPLFIDGAWKGIVFTGKLIRLDKAASACNRLSREFFFSAAYVSIYIPGTFACSQTAEFCSRFFTSIRDHGLAAYDRASPYIQGTVIVLNNCIVRCQPVAEEIFREFAIFAGALASGSISLYHGVSPYVGRAAGHVSECCAPIVEYGCDAITTCATAGVSALRQRARPLVIYASVKLSAYLEKLEGATNSVFNNVIAPANTYVMSPVYNWVISPAGSFAKNFTHALLSGCCGNVEDEFNEGNAATVSGSQSQISITHSKTVHSRKELESALWEYGLKEVYDLACEMNYENGRTYSNLQSIYEAYDGETFTIENTEERTWVITGQRKIESISPLSMNEHEKVE